MHTPTIILLLGLAALSNAANISDQDGAWEFFKESHGKTYSTKLVEQFRRSLFEKTVKDVKAHNKRYLSGLETYSMAVNKFSDMMLSEVVGTGLPDLKNTNQEDMFVPVETTAGPGYIDWRTHPGVVTPVKDQGHCGSCWAFSATGSLEGQLMLKKNLSASLSEQQLLDCTGFTSGCHGGLTYVAYDYIKFNGIMSEESYPYTAHKEKCREDWSKAITKIGGFKRIPSLDETALQSAILNVGPIAVAVFVNNNFMHYDKGVLNDPECHDYNVNHAVLAVGYGHDEESGLDFYIVKNSWGESWGENGYIRIVANLDMCEIAKDALYPVF